VQEAIAKIEAALQKLSNRLFSKKFFEELLDFMEPLQIPGTLKLR
jgi:hypothetical protein